MSETFYYYFAQVYNCGAYGAGDFGDGDCSTGSGGLVDTGFAIMLAVAVAALLIFITILVMVLRRKSKKSQQMPAAAAAIQPTQSVPKSLSPELPVQNGPVTDIIRPRKGE